MNKKKFKRNYILKTLLPVSLIAVAGVATSIVFITKSCNGKSSGSIDGKN
jgi:hypothetical protein